MTLGELSAAWNELRNAAWGRGTQPLVDAKLADQIGAGYEAWRAYYEESGFTDEFAPSIAASEWVDRYRMLAAKMAEAGHPLTGAMQLPPTPLEQATSTLRWGVGLVVGLSVATLIAAFVRGRS